MITVPLPRANVFSRAAVEGTQTLPAHHTGNIDICNDVINFEN